MGEFFQNSTDSVFFYKNNLGGGSPLPGHNPELCVYTVSLSLCFAA